MGSGRFTRDVDEHIEAVRSFFGRDGEAIEEVARAMAAALEKGGKVLFFGNGGSAADAQHLAAELVNRMSAERPGIPAVALTTDTSALTSIANDRGYDRVFARQVEALGSLGDVAFGLSTSGKSPSIIEALRVSRAKGLLTVALLGGEGGPAREHADHALVVPSGSTARIQEVHILAGHLICEAVEALLYPERSESS